MNDRQRSLWRNIKPASKWKSVYANESIAGRLSVAIPPSEDAVLISWQGKNILIPDVLVPKLRQALEAAEEELGKH